MRLDLSSYAENKIIMNFCFGFTGLQKFLERFVDQVCFSDENSTHVQITLQLFAQTTSRTTFYLTDGDSINLYLIQIIHK